MATITARPTHAELHTRVQHPLERLRGSIRTYVGLDAHRILAIARFLNSLVAEIRSKNLDCGGYALLLHEFEESNRSGICFFSGGTAGDPDADGIRR